MVRLGLIGKNIHYTKSPNIHKTVGKFLGIELQYDVIDIEENELINAINQLRSGYYQGLNVTIPHKENVIQFVDELSPSATKIQAVNTLYMSNGKLIGDNTDYAGFLGTLSRENINVTNCQVLILGTGGAAKACYHALVDQGANVFVCSRNKNLKKHPFQHIISYDEIEQYTFDLIVNATPIGTYPDTEKMAVPSSVIENKTVIDLIYNPSQTMFMRHARRGIGGLSMIIIQAIKSDEKFFNQTIELSDERYQLLKEVVLHE